MKQEGDRLQSFIGSLSRDNVACSVVFKWSSVEALELEHDTYHVRAHIVFPVALHPNCPSASWLSARPSFHHRDFHRLP
jgi:hypothetical protein